MEQDLAQATLLSHHATASRDKAESDSQRVSSQLQRARQDFAATLLQLQESQASEVQILESASQKSKLTGGRGPEEVARETSELRNSLHTLCQKLQQQSQKSDLSKDTHRPAWLQGVVDIGGQVLLAMASLGEVNHKLQLAEMQLKLPRQAATSETHKTNTLAVSDLDAKRLQDQAAQDADVLRLQAAASEQALLRDEATSLRNQLDFAEGCNSVHAKTCMDYARGIRTGTGNCIDEAYHAAAPVFIEHAEVSQESVGPLLVRILESLANAQRWALASELESATWKELIQQIAARDKALGELASTTAQPRAPAVSPVSLVSPFVGELCPASMADRCVGLLEAQCSNISNQWHHAVSMCCKLEMDLRSLDSQTPAKTEAAYKEAAAAMLRQKSMWNQELLQRCIAWLSRSNDVSDWQAMAAVRELGLERSLRDMVSLSQSLREKIWSLEAEHESLRAASSFWRNSSDGASKLGRRDGHWGLQQHIDSLKSELGSARRELGAVKEQFDTIVTKLHGLPDSSNTDDETPPPAGSGGNEDVALAQIYPALTSIARQLQQFCRETDTQSRSDSCHLILEELRHTRSWCKQVEQELQQQAALSKQLLATSGGEISASYHRASSLSTDLSVADLDRSLTPGMKECQARQCATMHSNLLSIRTQLRPNGVLNRVEAILNMQQDLQTGYRAVTRELHELQNQKQAQECLGHRQREQSQPGCACCRPQAKVS